MDLSSKRRRVLFECLMAIIALSAGVSLIWMSAIHTDISLLQLASAVAFALSVFAFLWLVLDPDTHAARNADELLILASKMLDCMSVGLNAESAQKICELLLPVTSAIAVAITDREVIMGYAGYNAEENGSGQPIRTVATRRTLEDGKARVLHSADQIGLPPSSLRIHAAIVQPLYVGDAITGTLKFYYRKSRQVSKTQQSLARGFAELISTQMAAAVLEEQVKLTTSMELKALQAQINPHFLFNTLNTIASLIRTDPAKARELLREFAAFYRSTLEDSEDLIELERELKQVERYLMFEVARFGEDRLKLEIEVDPTINSMLVPSFMIQPLVENAVRHGMRVEGQLVIRIVGFAQDDRIIIQVIDNGVGMSEEKLKTMMSSDSGTGLGIAVKNVKDRIRGYFGPDSRMEVTSELDVGTTVTFTFDWANAKVKERELPSAETSAVSA